jgi:hypothetical protein
MRERQASLAVLPFEPAERLTVPDPLLPVECGPLRCVGYHELVGKSVRLTLPMRVNGTVQAYEWTLRITDAVKSVRGGRPKRNTRRAAGNRRLVRKQD